MSATPCMGGWCAKRDHCAHYHAASVNQTPAERLCAPGHDGEGLTAYMETSMPKKMPLEARLDQAEALLTDAGLTLEMIIGSLGMCRTQCVRIITRLCRAGRAFRFRGKLVEDAQGSALHAIFFKTEAARDQYVADYQARMKVRSRELQRVHHNEWARRNPEKVRASVERYRSVAASRAREYRLRKAQERAAVAALSVAERQKLKEERDRERIALTEAKDRQRAEERAMARAMHAAEKEQAKLRARLDREAAAAAKKREKAEARKTTQRLKAETKAAGKTVFKSGTVSQTPAKPRGPAHLAGELDLSHAKVTKAEPPPERFAPTDVPPCFSSLRPGEYLAPARAWVKAVAA